MILLSLLCISILVALILAFVGDWRYAPEVNIGGSLLTFIVSLVLALQEHFRLYLLLCRLPEYIPGRPDHPGLNHDRHLQPPLHAR